MSLLVMFSVFVECSKLFSSVMCAVMRTGAVV